MRTVLELLNLSREYLTEKGVSEPRLEAEFLLSHVLKKSRLELYLDYSQPVNEREVDLFREYIRERGRRKPIQYIIGETEFYGLRIELNEAVLIPRPETELLVEKIIALVSQNSLLFPGEIVVFEVGTGSGCIAVALAKKLAGVKVYASDVSARALEVARKNARAHGVEAKIKFVEGDLEQAFSGGEHLRADILVSNAPYISEAEMAELDPEVAEHEPRLALYGGTDGLEVLRRLIPAGRTLLKEGGWLFLEIGYRQAEALTRLLQKSGSYGEIELFEDHHGIKRIVRARWFSQNSQRTL